MLPNRQPSVANQEQQHVPSATCLLSLERSQKLRHTKLCQNDVHGRSLAEGCTTAAKSRILK